MAAEPASAAPSSPAGGRYRGAMDLSYDSTANSAYLPLSPGAQRTHRVVGGLALQGMNGEVIFDLDASGRIIGIEFDGARELLNPEVYQG